MRPVSRRARSAHVGHIDQCDVEVLERSAHRGDHVQRGRSLAGRRADGRAELVHERREVCFGELVALGVNARAERSADRTGALLLHGGDGFGEHTFGETTPPCVRDGHRGAAVVDKHDGGTVSGDHGYGRARNNGYRGIRRSTRVLAGRVHYNHVSAVDLPEPGPGEVGDDVTAIFRPASIEAVGRPEVAVRGIGEADLGGAEPQRPQPVT